MSETIVHWLRAEDGVRLALHRLPPARDPGIPVLLVPGTFSNHQFWVGKRDAGFAHALARRGYDPWVLEVRNHGSSDTAPRSTMEDWIRYDAPVAVRHILSATGQNSLYWVGHSAGAVLGTAYLGAKPANHTHIRGLILLGAPGPKLHGVRRVGAWLARRLSRLGPEARVPGRFLRLGPGHEPGTLVTQWMGWNLEGRWIGESGDDYLAELPAMPVLGIGGAGDRWMAPPDVVEDLLRRFPGDEVRCVIAGCDTGFSQDLGHANILLGQPAREEVWPIMLDWLDEQTSRNPGKS